jgi:hypothetical protein
MKHGIHCKSIKANLRHWHGFLLSQLFFRIFPTRRRFIFFSIGLSILFGIVDMMTGVKTIILFGVGLLLARISNKIKV